MNILQSVYESILGLSILLTATVFSPSSIPEKGVGDAFSAAEFNEFINSTKLFHLDDNDTALDFTDDLLGIGQIAPAYRLDVAGSANMSGNVTATYFIGDGSLLSGIDSSQWVTNGADINYPTGEVGIGVADPLGNLDIATANDANLYVRSTGADGREASLHVRGAHITSAISDLASLYLQNNANSDENLARVSAGNADSVPNTSHGKLYLATNDGLGLATALAIDENQQVGIGTITPDQALDVVGDINFTGDLYQNDVLFAAGKFTDGVDANDAVYSLGNVGIGINDPTETLSVDGNIAWGSGLLKTDQGGSLELGDASSNPYIDFKNDPTSDFDVRLSLIGNDTLEIAGGTLVAPEPTQATEVATKIYVDKRTAFAQVANTAVADVNSATGAVITFNTTALQNSDASVFTPLNTGVQVQESGVYEVQTNIYLESGTARTNVGIEFTVNGTQQGIRGAGAYARNLDSHDESSAHLSQILTLSANDIVGVMATQLASAGTVALPVGQSNLIIKRLQ